MKNFATAVGILIALPLSFLLQYMILSRVPDATDLMWFLFWFNLPITVFIRLAIELSDDKRGVKP